MGRCATKAYEMGLEEDPSLDWLMQADEWEKSSISVACGHTNGLESHTNKDLTIIYRVNEV